MKKIGIITEYYESRNYGGVLQAYALCKIIQEMGYECEQIPYMKISSISDTETHSSLVIRMKKALNPISLFQFIKRNVERRIMNRLFEKRTEAFRNFRDNCIPHDSKAYADDTIRDTVEKYDTFITGSDQVWNPAFYSPSYLLEFVPNEKRKLSYAASLSVDKLSAEQRAYFKKCLQTFDAVSVREQNSIDLLKDICPVTVNWTLDPTLLLSEAQWEAMASKRKIEGNYIFTYFLGEDITQRNLTEQFAKKHNLKIVTMPYIWGKYRACDKKFGNIRLFDVAPQDFLSLIKYAEYIFTDSFHAVVFSLIFRKQFWVFQRSDYKGMSTRLYSLTKLFSAETHFCDTEDKQNLFYLEEQKDVEYKKVNEGYMKFKESSLQFLRDNLG